MTAYLSDDIITLRALEPTDLDILYKWENDTSLWEVGNTIAPFSRAQLWEYIQNYDGDIFRSHQLRLMIMLNANGETIGTIDFYDFDPFNDRAAIGILIDKSYQNKGYGKKAVNLTLRYALKYLGLCQVLAIVPVDNDRSVELFKKCGFSSVGKIKSWLKTGRTYRDVLLMQYLFRH